MASTHGLEDARPTQPSPALVPFRKLSGGQQTRVPNAIQRDRCRVRHYVCRQKNNEQQQNRQKSRHDSQHESSATTVYTVPRTYMCPHSRAFLKANKHIFFLPSAFSLHPPTKSEEPGLRVSRHYKYCNTPNTTTAQTMCDTLQCYLLSQQLPITRLCCCTLYANRLKLRASTGRQHCSTITMIVLI